MAKTTRATANVASLEFNRPIHCPSQEQSQAPMNRESLFTKLLSCCENPVPQGLGRSWCWVEMHGITELLDLALHPLRPFAFHRFRDGGRAEFAIGHPLLQHVVDRHQQPMRHRHD